MKPLYQIITLLPEMFDGFLAHGVIHQALKKDLFAVDFINPREFTSDVHHTVDDRPFGGGDGMVMLAAPLTAAVERAKAKSPATRVVYLSPQGLTMSAELAAEMAEWPSVTFVCGRYGGVDQRWINQQVDLEIAVGDFVVSGGELPTMMVIDAVLRKVPGVLGSARSSAHDSFEGGWLEAPQFTRPRDFQGQDVPEVLTSGDHKAIETWRKAVAVLKTFVARKDLFNRQSLPDAEKRLILKTLRTLSEGEWQALGLSPAQLAELEAVWK